MIFNLLKKNDISFYFLSKSILQKNFKNYTFLINIFKTKFIIIGITNFKHKHYWSNNLESLNSDFLIQFISLQRSIFNFKKFLFSENLGEIINLKKKSSIIKKINDCKFNILSRSNFNKDNFSLVKNLKNNLKYNTQKSIDLSRKIKPLINVNRSILKFILKFKYSKIFAINKYLKKLLNTNKIDFFLNFEFNILNIIQKSDFFFNYNDLFWFFKNKLISVNGETLNNKNLLANAGDIINICYNNYYYYFYRNNLSSNLNFKYKLKYKFWSIINNRSKNLNLKENYPKIINNYKYFKKDIPIYLEVDFITMNIIILKYNFNIKLFDYYTIKFLNLYLYKTYNWKYII